MLATKMLFVYNYIQIFFFFTKKCDYMCFQTLQVVPKGAGGRQRALREIEILHICKKNRFGYYNLLGVR